VNATRRLMPGDSWIGCVSVMRTHVFLAIWFQKEHCEALFSVSIMGYVLWSMVKSKAENSMEAEFLRTSSGSLSLCSDEKLPW
jgi:hypothetical protein